jgi:hypothetical protein
MKSFVEIKIEWKLRPLNERNANILPELVSTTSARHIKCQPKFLISGDYPLDLEDS